MQTYNENIYIQEENKDSIRLICHTKYNFRYRIFSAFLASGISFLILPWNIGIFLSLIAIGYFLFPSSHRLEIQIDKSLGIVEFCSKKIHTSVEIAKVELVKLFFKKWEEGDADETTNIQYAYGVSLRTKEGDIGFLEGKLNKIGFKTYYCGRLAGTMLACILEKSLLDSRNSENPRMISLEELLTPFYQKSHLSQGNSSENKVSKKFIKKRGKTFIEYSWSELSAIHKHSYKEIIWGYMILLLILGLSLWGSICGSGIFQRIMWLVLGGMLFYLIYMSLSVCRIKIEPSCIIYEHRYHGLPFLNTKHIVKKEELIDIETYFTPEQTVHLEPIVEKKLVLYCEKGVIIPSLLDKQDVEWLAKEISLGIIELWVK